MSAEEADAVPYGRTIKVLKSYAVNDLRAGMIVGRDVQDVEGRLVARSGDALTERMIEKLTACMIFSVYIDEEEDAVEIPGREFLLDDAYVNCYEKSYQRTQRIYQQLARDGKYERDEIETVLAESNAEELCDGAKAVSQIHNMSTDGNHVIHHAIHMAILGGLMGKWLRWPKDRVKDLMMAGLLHDVGKMVLPQEILEKRGNLTDEEFAQLKRHPEKGYDMLKAELLDTKREVLISILQHHERCDGSGYPNRSRKEQINEYARVLAILDIYDAMATTRVHARRSSPFDVLRLLNEDVFNGKLDTEYGVLFMRNICQSLNGNWVGLSNGGKARIVYIDASRVTALPVVQTVKGEFIDLNTRKDIKVDSILTARELG